jgi:Leucine-rich repeat (LRR) protein
MRHQRTSSIQPLITMRLPSFLPSLPPADAVRVTRSRAAQLKAPIVAYFPQLEDLRVHIKIKVSELNPSMSKSEPEPVRLQCPPQPILKTSSNPPLSQGQDARKLPAKILSKALPVLSELEVLCDDESLQRLGSLASSPRLKAMLLRGHISALPALPSPMEELVFCSDIVKQIGSISTLANLRVFHLFDCDVLADLSPIKACGALRSLQVSRCHDLTVWPDLGALADLRSLQIDDSSGPSDWRSLAALTALSYLDLSRVSINLEPLAGLTQLQDLTLAGVYENEADDLGVWRERLTSSLTGLVDLTSLNLACTWMGTLQWCSALPNLRNLWAGGNLFTSLESLPGLSLPQLTVLVLNHSHFLKALGGLEGCKNLAKLNLMGCTSLSSLEPLKDCPKLTELDVARCKANLPGLEHLRGLPNLKITGP